MRRTTLAAGLAALMSLVIAVEYATPVAAALFDGPAAKAACEAAVAVYGPANTGEQLSACQWDMRRINAGPASYAKSTAVAPRGSAMILPFGVNTYTSSGKRSPLMFSRNSFESRDSD